MDSRYLLDDLRSHSYVFHLICRAMLTIRSPIRRPSCRLVRSQPRLHHRLHRYRRLLPNHLLHERSICLLRPSSGLCASRRPYHSQFHQYDHSNVPGTSGTGEETRSLRSRRCTCQHDRFGPRRYLPSRIVAVVLPLHYDHRRSFRLARLVPDAQSQRRRRRPTRR